MRGAAGRQVFHQSILNILISAGLCPAQKKKIPFPPLPKKKSVPVSFRKPVSQTYNPLRILRERLSSMRASRASCSDQPSSHAPSQRQSVIKPRAMQDHYAIPVSNPFSPLGNWFVTTIAVLSMPAYSVTWNLVNVVIISHLIWTNNEYMHLLNISVKFLVLSLTTLIVIYPKLMVSGLKVTLLSLLTLLKSPHPLL